MFYIGKIQETKHFKNLASFRLFMGKCGRNSATELYGRLHFYSAPFELRGRRIGQLGTLRPSSPARRPPWRQIKKMGEPRAMEGRDGNVEGI
jgi:hypothetical protein